MADEFIVKSAVTERLYVKAYHDFLDSELLNGKEKIIFLLLKRYLNFKGDDSGITGNVYPTLDTLSRQAGMTKKTVAGIIEKLEEKGLIQVKQQGLNRPNIYTLRDYGGIWQAKTEAELKTTIESYDEDAEDAILIERLRKRGYTIVKEKESVSKADQSKKDTDPSYNCINVKNNTMNDNLRQESSYSLEDIREHFEYDIMCYDHPDMIPELDAVMNIIQVIMRATKKTLRVGGIDIAAQQVKDKIWKLDQELIVYTINKYKEADAIKDPNAYMTTLLYRAADQYTLEIANKINLNK